MGKPKPSKAPQKPTSKKDPKEKEEETKPNWPPLRPSPPKAHTLSLTPLLPSHIYITTGLLPAPLCKAYVSFLSSLQLSTTPVQRGKDYAARVNDRFQVWDPAFARVLWEGTALKELVLSFLHSDAADEGEGEGEDGAGEGEGEGNIWDGVPIGLNPNIRVYRYSAGQFFAKHCMFFSPFLFFSLLYFKNDILLSFGVSCIDHIYVCCTVYCILYTTWSISSPLGIQHVYPSIPTIPTYLLPLSPQTPQY